MGNSIEGVRAEPVARPQAADAARPSRLRRLLDRFPPAARTALWYETLSNLAAGAYLTTFSVALLFLKGALGAPEWQVALLAICFFGSSLFSPLVTYVGRLVPMRTLVVVPNLVVAAMLPLVWLPSLGWIPAESASLFFALLIGATFVVRVFPRSAEMNMYRVIYPDGCRSTAIGITKAGAAFTGLATTFVGWGIFALAPGAYPLLFCLIGVLLLASAWFYARIPVPPDAPSLVAPVDPPVRAFVRGLRVFLADRRFLNYQLAFSLAGIANHMSLWYVVDVLEDGIHAGETVQSWVVAILPALFVILSSPIWGRALDGWNPMSARAVFNVLQAAAYAFYALGGFLVAAWPFVVGAVLHAIGNGGGLINWLTGSLYFAPREHVSLYNGIHVCLTGIRGIIGPIVGVLLAIDTADVGGLVIHGLGLGWGVFVVSAVLSIVGSAWMLLLNVGDSGPVDADAEAEPID